MKLSSVNLSNPVNASIADTQGQGTIINDDQKPSLSVADIALTEGNAGTKDFIFTVTLSSPTGADASVSFAINDGTATVANSDYQDTSGILTFTAGGALTQTITVKVNGDTTFEADETFTVALSGAIDATIANSNATGTILNDDLPVITGRIFEDLDGDGFQDLDEFGIQNVQVKSIDSLGTTRNSTTDLNGFFTVSLAAGPAFFDVNNGTVPVGYVLTTSNDPQVVVIVGPSMNVPSVGYKPGEIITDSAPAFGNGNDTLFGGSGDDKLYGIGGNDFITGGHWIGPGLRVLWGSL